MPEKEVSDGRDTREIDHQYKQLAMHVNISLGLLALGVSADHVCPR